MLDIACLLFEAPALIFQAFDNQDRHMQIIETVQHAAQLGLIPKVSCQGSCLHGLFCFACGDYMHPT